MVWPFGGPAPFLDQDSEDWHLQAWGWLLKNMGGLQALRRAPLVLPTLEFFPTTGTQGHARVEEVLQRVKDLAGMGDWPVLLEPQPERAPVRVTNSVNLVPRGDVLPLGTFGPHGNEVLITYDPDLLNDPFGLVATLAHELAHYRLHSFPDHPPGDEAMEEFATDLATAAMGFGVFGAITALQFEGGGGGWTLGWRRAGYLHPRDWAFALAVFTALRGEEMGPLKPWLRDTVYEEALTARRYLKRKPELLAPLLAL